jgi:hypothetical protein|nr:MAG TPA: hypothetical protein [Caudoviricetes sp.]
MKDKLAKLINVKSIITLILCAVFAYLSAIGHITAEQFLTIFTVVISFYFGTQAQKNADVDKADKQDMIS